ncbi:hypothetical protein D6779_11610 [Candidatus Parcubacteria bacterium]|nr:MAG: hypothetical protein D6779_11610 [Candidatus Parcubacteria bacterium]
MIFWQNYYNEVLVEQAQRYGVDPALLKGQMLQESNGALDPGDYCQINGQMQYCGNNGATGLMQITADALGDVLGNAPEALLEQIVELYNYTGGPNPGVSPRLPVKRDNQTYKDYYLSLGKDSAEYKALSELALRFIDGRCFAAEAAAGLCVEGEIQPDEGKIAIQLAAAINDYNRTFLRAKVPNWEAISRSEQEKIVLAAYNGGVNGIGNAVLAAQERYGAQVTWEQVKEMLMTGRATYTLNWCQAAIYPDNILCYARSKEDCNIQMVTGECAP